MKIVSSHFVYGIIKRDVNQVFEANDYFKIIGNIITISNIEINEKIIFDETFRIENNIYFDNCTFNEIEFDDCVFNQIWFKNCTINNNLILKNGHFLECFWFQDCDFNSSFIIRNTEIKSALFDNVKIEKYLRIEGGNFDSLTFIPRSENDILKISGLLTFIENLILKPNNGIKIIIEKTFIKSIYCNGYLNNNSRIDLSDVRINFSIEFDNVKNDGKIYLKNFLALPDYPIIFDDKSIDIINFKDFEENAERLRNIVKSNKINTVGKLYNNKTTPEFLREIILKKYFSSITRLGEKKTSEKSFFKLKDSSIGYIELIDFDINQYKNIMIESSDLSNIKLINSYIPTNKKLKSNDKSYLNHYSIYNNLYVSAKNQNNIKDRNKYFQASQKYLLKNLKNNFIKNLPSISSNYISKWFSNYGQSWIQSLTVTLLLSTLFFGFFLLSFKNLEFDLSYDGWMFFQMNYLKYLPEFINPTHKIDFIDDLKNEIGDWTRFLDFFGRIIVGIGIYETIKSFRKYVN